MSICNLLKNTSKIPLFYPYIDIFIYDILSIKMHNQEFFDTKAKQKFNKLYINNQKEGLIHPIKYTYRGYVTNFNSSNIYNNKRVYCSDILSSNNTGKEITILNNFYNFYKLQLTKETYFSNKSFFYYENRFNDILETIRYATTLIQNIHLTTYSNNIIDDAFIFNIKLDYNDKIVMFGDFHGSFHAFYRNFLRLHLLGIIDFQNYIINDPYKIIFLGDIADRGQYALEIYYIICKFICQNNGNPDNLKIILNRGNHEDPEVMKKFGFYNELSKKNKNGLIRESIIELLKYCSSGIVLTYKDKNQTYRYWLSHGGIPVITNEIYTITDDRCIQIKETNKTNAMRSYPISIRWCDYDPTIKKFTQCYNYGRNKISCNDLHNFLKLNKIDFVIRGHNDNTENAYLFSNSTITNYFSFQLNNPDIYNNNDDNNYIIFPKSSSISTKSTSIKRIDGPLSRIITKNWYNKDGFLVKMNNLDNKPINVYPVLTISTNSDVERSLKDSFIILNMNLDQTSRARLGPGLL